MRRTHEERIREFLEALSARRCEYPVRAEERGECECLSCYATVILDSLTSVEKERAAMLEALREIIRIDDRGDYCLDCNAAAWELPEEHHPTCDMNGIRAILARVDGKQEDWTAKELHQIEGDK